MTTLQSDAFLLDGERAAAMARIALGHVEREYPNHIMHNLQDERDINGPRALHPVFSAATTGTRASIAIGYSRALLTAFPSLRRRKRPARCLPAALRPRR
ncbi:hypothetical protein SODG_005744 [Sodalis praecaptivus]